MRCLVFSVRFGCLRRQWVDTTPEKAKELNVKALQKRLTLSKPINVDFVQSSIKLSPNSFPSNIYKFLVPKLSTPPATIF